MEKIQGDRKTRQQLWSINIDVESYRKQDNHFYKDAVISNKKGFLNAKWKKIQEKHTKKLMSNRLICHNGHS